MPMATSASGGGGGAAVGEAREGGPPRDETEIVRAAMSETPEVGAADEGEAAEDEVRGSAGRCARRRPAERRTAAPPSRTPRRTPPAWRDRKTVWPDRSRTNSRRHRPRKPSSAVADFDGVSEPAATVVEPEPAAASERTAACGADCGRNRLRAVRAGRDRAGGRRSRARRRSTVREKVSFLSSAPPDTAPAMPSTIEPSAPAPAPAPAETAPADDERAISRARPAGGRDASAAASSPHTDFDKQKPPGKTGRFLFGASLKPSQRAMRATASRMSSAERA